MNKYRSVYYVSKFVVARKKIIIKKCTDDRLRGNKLHTGINIYCVFILALHVSVTLSVYYIYFQLLNEYNSNKNDYCRKKIRHCH